MKQVLLLLQITLAMTMDLPPQHPVIGIYTIPQKHKLQNKPHDSTYLSASYVKFIQMSGAQVVPLFAYSSKEQIQYLLPKLNGVLFPGGGADITPTSQWIQNARLIIEYAKKQSQNKTAFPVFGICLGWELISYLTTNDQHWRQKIVGQQNILNSISILDDGNFYDGISSELRDKLENDKILYFNHSYAVNAAYFKDSKLKDFWKLVSTSKNKEGVQFVSSAQAISYPFYGVQYHPQKSLFQWKLTPVDRSKYSRQIAHFLSGKFIDQAKKNKNRFTSNDQFANFSIHRFATFIDSKSFSQIYKFPQPIKGQQQTNDSQVWFSRLYQKIRIVFNQL